MTYKKKANLEIHSVVKKLKAAIQKLNFLTSTWRRYLGKETESKENWLRTECALVLKMLLYYNKSFFWLLVERRGSVFYRCLATLLGFGSGFRH